MYIGARMKPNYRRPPEPCSKPQLILMGFLDRPDTKKGFCRSENVCTFPLWRAPSLIFGHLHLRGERKPCLVLEIRYVMDESIGKLQAIDKSADGSE